MYMYTHTYVFSADILLYFSYLKTFKFDNARAVFQQDLGSSFPSPCLNFIP